MLASAFINSANIRSRVLGSFTESMPSLIFSRYSFTAFFLPSTSVIHNNKYSDSLIATVYVHMVMLVAK